MQDRRTPAMIDGASVCFRPGPLHWCVFTSGDAPHIADTMAMRLIELYMQREEPHGSNTENRERPDQDPAGFITFCGLVILLSWQQVPEPSAARIRKASAARAIRIQPERALFRNHGFPALGRITQ